MATITDDFDRADSTSLGTASGGFSWTETLGGNLSIVSNAATGVSGGINLARAESDLDTADHYAELFMAQAGDGHGLVVRFDPTANNGYLCEISTDSCRIFRMDAGSLTQIGSSGAGDGGLNKTIRLSITGSNLTLTIDGVTNTTASDSNHTSFTRTGIYANNNGTSYSFEAGDNATQRQFFLTRF